MTPVAHIEANLRCVRVTPWRNNNLKKAAAQQASRSRKFYEVLRLKPSCICISVLVRSFIIIADIDTHKTLYIFIAWY